MSRAMTYRSDLITTLVERGYHYQATDLDALDAYAAKTPVTAYIGFDATAPSLHVGSLVQIMLLRRVQQAGGKPIVLIGGGTTKVGDPSFKDTARPILGSEQIELNKIGIQRVFNRFLEFGDGPTDAIMVDNDDWLSGLSYIEFLRDYGRHFSINRMIAMESVKRRLEREQSLSFLEFNYMLLQAYDFLELHRRHDCRLQLGGSDQWGNIVNGVELCRRADDAEVFGFTSPLITTASGAKMGKTVDGAVWLDEQHLSPYDYWQFWRNAEDADVERFLRLFTDMPLDEIARLAALEGAEINDAKIALANAATAMLHGETAARKAEATARETFEQGAASAGLPSYPVSQAELDEGLSVLAAFERSELVGSRGEARRHIKAGALKVNDAKVDDQTQTLSPADIQDGVIKLSVGKKKHALLTLG